MTNDLTNDPYRMQADHLPTPFTADAIRAVTPAGYTVETETEAIGEVAARHRIEFTEVDDERAVMVSTPIDESGEPVGDPRANTADWLDLQAHASFPAGITTITDDTIETPLGTLNCRRYDVRGDDHTNTFWFSPSHPGMPVRFTSDADHAPTTTVTAIHRPS